MAGLDWSKQRILIAEHDSAIAGQIEGLLKRLGAGAVRSAASGQEVVEALSSFVPSLMLLEVNLTGMSGLDVTRWVRSNPKSPNPDIAIIVMAAAADTDALRRMCGIGIESFIRKPIDPEKLVRRVAKTIAKPSRFISTLDYFGPDRRRPKPADYRYRGAEHRRPVAVKPKVEAVAPPPQAKAKPAVPPPPRPAPPSDEEKRQRDAEWQIAAAEESAAPPAPARDSGEDWQAAMTEQEPAPAQRDSGAEWQQAVAEEEEKRRAAQAAEAAAAAAADPGVVLSSAVEEHVKWLRSGGSEGTKAALAGQDLAGVECPQANLTNANLRGIDLSGANLRGATMQGADLRGANLTGTDLSEGDLASAKMRHANLTISRLGGTKLVDADLAGATFKGAAMEDTDLRGANLLGANLQGADLRQAAGLVQTQIDKAMADRETRLPPGLQPPLEEE